MGHINVIVIFLVIQCNEAINRLAVINDDGHTMLVEPASTEKLADDNLVRTCYTGGSTGHGFMDLPTQSGACSTQFYYPPPDGEKTVYRGPESDTLDGQKKELLAGCGFSSVFSSTQQSGWGGGQNVGGSHSSGNNTASAIFSFVPGVRTGSVHGMWGECTYPETWALVPEICVRAVINEVGPEFSEHRQWAWSAVARWVADNHTFRQLSEDSCGDEDTRGNGLKTRANIIKGSWGGVYKDDELCWDYILAIKSLVCRAKVTKGVPYGPLCQYTAAAWEAEDDAKKLTVLKQVRTNFDKPGSNGRDFFADWANLLMDRP